MKNDKTTKTAAPKKSLASDIVAKADARKKAVDKAAAAALKEKAAQAAVKAKADEAKVNAAHGVAISRAAEKGIAIASRAFGATGLTENLDSALSKGVSKNISITSTGLTVKKGSVPTEIEITEALAGLCGINEETAKFRTTVTWAIGDAALLAEAIGGGDRVVTQAIKERGVSKHTVMQAAAVCRDFLPEDRIAAVSFTHHQELRNYRKSIKNKKGYEKLIEELREQAKADEVMPCSELRERLQILAGKKADEQEDEKPAKDKKSKGDEPNLFLYISDDGDVKYSRGFNAELCKRYGVKGIIIDATDLTVLNDDGNLDYSIKEESNPVKAPVIEAEVVKPKAEPKKAEPKAEPKKAEAKKAKATQAPD
tara:strand:- start:2300 stop:3406 length:1107 start_codon:yes stop_codon:yes gene_type:complete